MKIESTALRKNAIDRLSISNYRILELIGSGGMANIYKAIQLSLDRPVALKIMHQHLSLNEGFVARFEKEAKQAAHLHHENIVSIIDYGRENGEYYIAMEYVDGRNLKELLASQKRLPLEISLLICQQVAEGLKYAHNQNLVHRDIKPANIILSNDGRVMITDFGIAKGDDDLSITATGQMIGSPAYMSPEQAAGRLMDHRSDIFSLGIILYEIIAGEKPFKGDTYQAMVASIISRTPEQLRKTRVDVNDEIQELVERAITKDVESRFQSAEDFSDAVSVQLERFKIPPARKLISSFLKNPSKMTEKLRTEKVSSHMESALYFLAQGESRLKDARREFEDVLRFDKNNKSAKKYLARLESHISTPVTSADEMKSDRHSRLLRILAIAVIAVAILASILLIPRHKDEGGAQKGESSSVESKKTGKQGGENSKKEASTASKAKSPETASKTTTGTKSTKTESGGKPKSTQTATSRKGGSYNYPDQSLKEYGTLTVKTNVPAEVHIDGKKYGSTNGPPIKLKPGRHFVEIEADGYRRMTRRIFTEKGKPTDLKIDLAQER